MRLEMSKKTDLVLKALGHLHSVDSSTGVDISEAIGTTVNYLPQVLRPLIVEGFICSSRGPGGGYRLCVDLDEVSLLEVIEVSEGEVPQGQCVLRGAPCPSLEPCALHDSWLRARGALLAELAETSVATALSAATTKGE